MRIWKIAIFECAVVAGIVCSAFIVPRDFPLKTFLMISASVLIGANILAFSRLRSANATGRKYRMSSRGYLDPKLCTVELRPILPQELFAELAKDDFNRLRKALEAAFSNWI